MESLKPKYYIETRFEKEVKFPKEIRKYHFPQPVEYCNGKSYWEYDEDSYERKNWGNLFWESHWFNECLKISRYNEKKWTDRVAMDKAFQKIFTKKSTGEGVYVPMKDFEIWLMCKGYDMISFDKMCAQSPCFAIFCDKQEGNVIHNPKGVFYTRFYHNNENKKTIYFGFGVGGENLRFNFYFVHSDKPYLHYQTPINEEDFEKAENCELKSFQELDAELRRKKQLAT